ncbi:peptidylprolyl isomerase [Silvibacterium sp.]|uniref:peptidylprolyl isomerase n=1 Tax=Silvibacterium sp. TaxID=1964179 RepID=UPI0039E38C03
MRRGMEFVLMLALTGGAGPLFAQASHSDAGAVVLDKVVGIVNGDVILESDVQEEIHFAHLEPIGVPTGSDTLQRAMRRLVSRTLILQQMKEQQQSYPVSNADIKAQLDEVRKSLPACKEHDCTTEDGWKNFLAANDLTEADVLAHWRQRIQILKFIDVRFRTGIRISSKEISDYYNKAIVTSFAKSGTPPPPLDKISQRIQEVLLQQHVNETLRDWLKTLRDEGSVQILDPAYGQSTGSGADTEEDD